MAQNLTINLTTTRTSSSIVDTTKMATKIITQTISTITIMVIRIISIMAIASNPTNFTIIGEITLGGRLRPLIHGQLIRNLKLYQLKILEGWLKVDLLYTLATYTLTLLRKISS